MKDNHRASSEQKTPKSDLVWGGGVEQKRETIVKKMI